RPQPRLPFCRLLRRPPSPPLFPYTTLFRSARIGEACDPHDPRGERDAEIGLAVLELGPRHRADRLEAAQVAEAAVGSQQTVHPRDRKSTRLNSSHVKISYAVFCLKKKKETN